MYSSPRPTPKIKNIYLLQYVAYTQGDMIIFLIAQNESQPIFPILTNYFFAMEKSRQKIGLLMLLSQYLAKLTIAQQAKIGESGHPVYTQQNYLLIFN
jgi:hypothetical protein